MAADGSEPYSYVRAEGSADDSVREYASDGGVHEGGVSVWSDASESYDGL